MHRLLKTLIIGWMFALVVESINMGIGKGQWTGMILTVLIFYGMFIGVGYWFAENVTKSPVKHLVTFGCIGLLAEWSLFGMSPWSGGNLMVVLLIQVGMFSHWGTVTFAPRLLLDAGHDVISLKKRFITSYLVGMGAVFIIGLLSPAGDRWNIMILGNVIVYSFLLLWYVQYIKLIRTRA